ncbi:MAG: hypothetical protein LBQ93_04810 [Treponema sp.]|jgi:hypothetical protein|nr:hypothetical protein [Treponema sp.]
MTNKKFWLGMLVMALVFGMTVSGCKDAEEGNDGSLDGTWTKSGGYKIIVSGNTYTDESPGAGGYTGKIKYDSSTIKFSTSAGLVTATYSLNGNNLAMGTTDHASFQNYIGTWTKE